MQDNAAKSFGRGVILGIALYLINSSPGSISTKGICCIILLSGMKTILISILPVVSGQLILLLVIETVSNDFFLPNKIYTHFNIAALKVIDSLHGKKRKDKEKAVY